MEVTWLCFALTIGILHVSYWHSYDAYDACLLPCDAASNVCSHRPKNMASRWTGTEPRSCVCRSYNSEQSTVFPWYHHKTDWQTLKNMKVADISHIYALVFCNSHTFYRRPVSRPTGWETQLPCAGTLRMWRQDGVCCCPYLLIPY